MERVYGREPGAGVARGRGDARGLAPRPVRRSAARERAGLVHAALRRQDAQARQPRNQIGVGERHALRGAPRARSASAKSRADWKRADAIAGERGAQHGDEIRRQVVAVALEHAQVGLVDAGEDVQLVAPREERAREQHLGQHDADRKQIAARIHLRANHLFGRHVAHLALELAGIGAAVDERAAHDAEVGELHLSGATDQDIAGGDVAVHDAERATLLVAGLVRERRARAGSRAR